MPRHTFGQSKLSYCLRAALDSAQVGLLMTVLSAPLSAQYQFDHWTTEHGLPQNSVNAVVQTRDGYLWLATNDGLARFDGVKFTVFDRGSTPGLESNRLMSLHEDRHGTLWIGAYEGLLVSYRDQTFFTYTARHGLPYDPINWIEEDAAGCLWLMGESGVTRWQGGRGFAYDLTGCLPGLRGDRLEQRRVWWATDGAGLHIFSGGRIRTYTQRDGLPSLKINSIYPDRRGNLYLGTRDAGLVKLADGRFTAHPLEGRWWPGERTGGRAYEDRQRGAWLLTPVGTGSESVMASLSDGQLTPHPAVKGSVADFCEDREGTLWIGTNKGLHHVRVPATRMLTDAARRRDRLDLSEWVYCVLEDRSGTIWLGKWGGGVARYRAGRFTHYVGGPEWRATLAALKNPSAANVTHDAGLFSSRVTSLYEDRADTIWVGTDGGVSRFIDGRFVRYSDRHGLTSTWAMYEDRAGDFWFATSTGLTRLRDGEFTVYTARDGLAHDDVKVIHEDRRGALWLGTHGGLTRYLDGRFTTFAEFGQHQVRAIYEDGDGVLWIGTYGSGLFRFEGGKFTRYTTRDGLFNNGTFQILEDRRGYFWMGSNKGVSRVSRRELNDFAAGKVKTITALPYGKEDGLLNVECNGGRQPAGWRTRDGRLWLPTMDGVAVIDPAAVPLNPVAPPVVIEEFLLDRQAQDFRRGVRLEPGQSNFEIRYAGLSFIKPEQVRFKYRLAGLHKEWVEAGTRRAADFSYVPPGEYVFEVTAANSDGVWSERAASLRVTIVPPLWRRWWFRGLLFAGLVGLTLLAYRLRAQHLRRESIEATRRRIQAEEGERERLATGLHGGLAQLIGNIETAARVALQEPKTPAPSRAQWEGVLATASEAMHEVREVIHGLFPHLLQEVKLTRSLRQLLRRAAESSGIHFTVELGELDEVFQPEAQVAFYRVVQECVNNLVKHSRATAAAVIISPEAERLWLSVEDNGQGFDPAAVAASRQRGGGFGLTNLNDLAKLLGGKLDLQSAPGQGTTVTLTINLKGGRHEP